MECCRQGFEVFNYIIKIIVCKAENIGNITLTAVNFTKSK